MGRPRAIAGPSYITRTLYAIRARDPRNTHVNNHLCCPSTATHCTNFESLGETLELTVYRNYPLHDGCRPTIHRPGKRLCKSHAESAALVASRVQCACRLKLHVDTHEFLHNASIVVDSKDDRVHRSVVNRLKRLRFRPDRTA